MQSLFTESEISRLLGIIDRNIIVLVAKVLGKESLTSLDKLILRQHNIDFNKIASNLPPYWKAYLFGRLTGQLTVPQAAQIDYNNFNKYLIQKQYTPPTSREIAEYRAASRRTYEYIKGMGERQKKALNTFISEGELEYLVETKRQETIKVVKERMDDGILRRQSVQKITSNIGHQLRSWNQDWGRIVETECQNIYTLGTAQNIMDVHGVDARVYFDVFPGACRHCISLYLTGGIGSMPRIFTVAELLANGTNIGRKSKDWKPVLGTVHPFCRCDLRFIPPGYEWDEDSKKFVPKPSENRVQRKSKVKITVGDLNFEV